jgi:CheY-like chemotaxis protein
VASALDASGLAPELLCLEITESVLLEDAEYSARALGILKDLGVRIGVDDFGTGYSSLTYLQRFPVDTLKVDRSFVDGLASQSGARGDRAIVAGVIDLAHAFGLTTVAEGVETEDQLAVLRSLGCEQAQGYLWSEPLPADQVVAWTREHAHAGGPVTASRGSRGTAIGVLVVEDDAPIRRVLCDLLDGAEGFHVVGEAGDGRQAIALARHHQPDLIVLDLAMPGMGGLEALPLLRAVSPNATILVLTAIDDASVEARALAEGATAVLSKAAGLDGLLALARRTTNAQA